MTALKYRKKPVVIEADHFSSLNGQRIADWINANGGAARYRTLEIKWRYDSATDTRVPYDGDNQLRIEIETLEGTMTANLGDWVIRGVAGEFYPCKPDIFEATYERAEESRPSAEQLIEEARRQVGDIADKSVREQLIADLAQALEAVTSGAEGEAR